MRIASILLLFLFATLLLFCDTMVVHTNEGNQSFETEEILNITFLDAMIIHTNDGDFNFAIEEISQITFEDVSAEDMVLFMSQIPIKFLQNYPNPFNPTTTIAFEISTSGQTTLDIYNSKGQKVTRLLNEELEAGDHSVIWDGTDNTGKKVPSGMYFSRVSVDDKQKVNKMIMIK